MPPKQRNETRDESQTEIVSKAIAPFITVLFRHPYARNVGLAVAILGAPFVRDVVTADATTPFKKSHVATQEQLNAIEKKVDANMAATEKLADQSQRMAQDLANIKGLLGHSTFGSSYGFTNSIISSADWRHRGD